jgi:hypothetical protein
MIGWLRCRVSKGMFNDEFAVTYPDFDRWQKSVFVPRTYVRLLGDEIGQVQVDYYNKDDAQFAVIPSEQMDIVRVENIADLEERADHIDR